MNRLTRPIFATTKWLVEPAVSIATLCVPPDPSVVVVHGWPDSEDNALAMIDVISTDDRYKLYVLCNGAVPTCQRDRVRYLPKNSARGFWIYLRANLIFFTHGLFTSPRAHRGRVIVNLWHGDGPKILSNAAYDRRPHSDLVVAGTRLWGAYKSEYFSLPFARVILAGNPRVQFLFDPAPESHLRLVGIDRPKFVLWMPTYRGTTTVAGAGWDDAESLVANGVMSAAVEEVLAELEDSIQLVVKPHPLDRENYADLGVLTITDADLHRTGVSLYRLLGAAAGLISDYSSVWVDFLALDRPIALFCPDLSEYEQRRGINVDNLAALSPGPFCTTPAQLAHFAGQLARAQDEHRLTRSTAAELIGVVTEPRPAAYIWAAALAFRAARSARTPFTNYRIGSRDAD